MKAPKIDTTPITNVFVVARKVIDFHKSQKNAELDLLKLLKLVYICFGFISAKNKRLLFSSKIEAWALGPVVPDLYYRIRPYLNEENSFSVLGVADLLENQNIKKAVCEDIDDICGYYLRKTSSTMVGLTHKEGTPWQRVFNGTPMTIIPQNTIIQHYFDLFFTK